MKSLAISGVLLACGAVLTAPASLHAQAAVMLDTSPSCADCVIRARNEITIGSPKGAGELPSSPVHVFEDARRRFWLLFPNDPPMIFDSTGVFLGTVGRRGRGPGEFLETSSGAAIGDSVLIIDRGLLRATVLGPDLKVSRTVSLPGSVRTVVVAAWPNSVVLHMHKQTPELTGLQLHLASFASHEASLLRSFGPASGAERSTNPALLRLELANLRNGRVWAVDVSQYQLTQWTPSGELQRRLTSAPPWMANPTNSHGMGGRNRPPAPMMMAITEDARGRVWVFGVTAAADWQAAWEGKKLVPGESSATSSNLPNPADLYQTIIEVVDPVRPRLLVRASWTGGVVGGLPNGRIVRALEDDDGVPRIVIAELELAERR